MTGRDIGRYERDYLDAYGFERTLVGFRRRVLLERLRMLAPQVVVEVGCGAELLYAHHIDQAGPVQDWTIVEPAPGFAAAARAAALPNARVVEAFLEAAVEALRAQLPRAPDLVVCSGLLNEVPSAPALLAAMRSLMDAGSRLHVNVANAASLHRRLAVAMGLQPTLHTLSERNVRMQQHRVYDAASLAAELERAGFDVIETGGYFVKPFTHLQMEAIAPALGSAVLEGLHELGRQDPGLACEIFVEARPR